MAQHQHTLFDPDPAPWELDDAAEHLVATVVIASGPEGEFDYLVPGALRAEVEPGRRLQVPLGRGNRLVTGYCVAVEMRRLGARRLKPIQTVIDSQRLLSPPMLRLTRWMADHYLCRLGQVIETVLPAGVRGQAGTRRVTVYRPAAPGPPPDKLSAKQARVLEVLRAAARPIPAAQLAHQAGCTQAPINALRKKGLIISEVQRVRNFHESPPQVARQPNLSLNADQQGALDSILAALAAAEHHTILMHGVTGSGKTEVYLQAVQEVIGFGRQAIVLVPEISLTPQTRERFRQRFDRVAVLHSHMSDVERAWHWEQIARGEVEVVVGARSAIFAPTPNLGLIVLDEEHEASFKQGEAPRYHARDVACRRAAAENIPLVLGSATPSLESWHLAHSGAYRLVSLPRRVLNRPMPQVATVDLRQEALDRRSRGAISRPLYQAMRSALDDGGQVILLLNRRGFSTHIQCPACGLVVRCPDCDIALTHHRQEEVAVCHYCDHRTAAPQVCPDCSYTGIRYSGRGTQKLEAEVRARFPDQRCLRMDTDSMQRPGSHEEALASFRRGEVRVLLGTQMIAKGLDFPNVTLVGVINADTALHLPDFRAAERTFQLVTQVAGRTGRGERGGRVLVQTFDPDHFAIRAAVRHDYAMFARCELPIRSQHGYPPYGSMIRLVVRGPAETTVSAFADQLAERIGQQLAGKGRLLGPAPAPIQKLRGNFRYQIQVHADDGPAIRQAVRAAAAAVSPCDTVQWIADVDPLEML